MLKTFIKYENSKFIKSYLYIAPVFLFLLSIVGIYIYRNIPILSSFGSSAIILFIIMTWITIINFNHDSTNERHILYCQLHSRIKYLNYKALYLLIFSCPLIVIALVYPSIIGAFDRALSLNLLVIGLIVHCLVSIFGILLGTFITNTLFESKKYTWLLTALIVVIMLTKTMLLESFPLFKWILWVFPPIDYFINLLTSDSLQLTDIHFMSAVLLSIVYSICAYLIIKLLFQKFSEL
ncbi:ABC transporter permease [Staphylococcus gallinarum]|uniref:ABC transporter permease n=1 Tax=Staphylococcus gallinarum TaxID=1293 RepID=A0A3A0VYW8_STAGA|nr:ABC transporter permease [Staphylococcus gallinarum]